MTVPNPFLCLWLYFIFLKQKDLYFFLNTILFIILLCGQDKNGVTSDQVWADHGVHTILILLILPRTVTLPPGNLENQRTELKNPGRLNQLKLLNHILLFSAFFHYRVFGHILSHLMPIAFCVRYLRCGI